MSQSRYPSIWWFAFGYFACYAPYSAMTKYLSKFKAISGSELLPVTAIASLVSMLVFITAMGWWKYAGHKKIAGFNVPVPGLWTFLSGLGTAAVIPTTTLAYTFSGVSIVFMMLLMRGGVLIIAPVTDFFSGRKVKWYSWVALLLSIASLFSAFFVGTVSYEITAVALLNLGIYLAAYFLRLRFMTRLAKSDDENARTRYFVEEQMVATPALVLVLVGLAFFGADHPTIDFTHGIAHGFEHPAHLDAGWSLGVVVIAIVIGILSQGTGVFGGLILLDKRENTFCVPVNRVSSLLAGVVASYSLWLWMGEKRPPANELVGVALLVCAIVALSVGPMIEKMQRETDEAVAQASKPEPAVAPAPAQQEARQKHG